MVAKKKPAKKVAETRTASTKNKALAKELQSNVKKVVEIEDAQKLNRSIGEKISVLIADFCGSMIFVWVHVIWFGSWVLMNSVFSFNFDPFPYTFLTLVVSLEAIFLSTFILISQNHETKLTERRNHLDLQINILTEQENTKMLEILQLIAEKVGVGRDDPEAAALLEKMEPEQLVEQIMSAKNEDPRDAKRTSK